MTVQSDNLDIQENYAVFFDICSSSLVLEHLMLTDHLKAMRNLLICMKRFLDEESRTLGFEVYKFLGDGWVLLFPKQTDGGTLVPFLEKLSCLFEAKFRKLVVPYLESSPRITGLTFGVDVGPLMRFVMLGRKEYVGRALNVASRLQSAIKDKDEKPQYKVLFSKPAYKELKFPANYRRIVYVRRTLRNILGENRYDCVKLTLKV